MEMDVEGVSPRPEPIPRSQGAGGACPAPPPPPQPRPQPPPPPQQLAQDELPGERAGAEDSDDPEARAGGERGDRKVGPPRWRGDTVGAAPRRSSAGCHFNPCAPPAPCPRPCGGGAGRPPCRGRGASGESTRGSDFPNCKACAEARLPWFRVRRGVQSEVCWCRRGDARGRAQRLAAGWGTAGLSPRLPARGNPGRCLGAPGLRETCLQQLLSGCWDSLEGGDINLRTVTMGAKFGSSADGELCLSQL